MRPGYFVYSTLFDMLARADRLGIPLLSALESLENSESDRPKGLYSKIEGPPLALWIVLGSLSGVLGWSGSEKAAYVTGILSCFFFAIWFYMEFLKFGERDLFTRRLPDGSLAHR